MEDLVLKMHVCTIVPSRYFFIQHLACAACFAIAGRVVALWGSVMYERPDPTAVVNECRRSTDVEVALHTTMFFVC